MSNQFIICTDINCPMNEGQECHSPFIFANENGECSIKDNGPYDNKSLTTNYVEVKECLCCDCIYWKEGLLNGEPIGLCDYGSDLTFDIQKDKSGLSIFELPPKCLVYSNQIKETGFAMNVPE